MNLRFTLSALSRKVILLLFTLALSALTFPSPTFAAGQPKDIKLERVDFPVTLSDGNTYQIAGYLYYHGSFRNRTLQVLVHGATYNHLYWDVPAINGHDYSYARYMAEQKYAVLAIDQLGAGASSKPDGDFVTLTETTSALHQVLSQLRSSENPIGYGFDRIVLVGHSFGSINAVYVQASYHDADALVTTGLGHVPHPLPIPPELIGALAQFPYFPLPPEARAGLFYYAPEADPDVIAYDNANLADQLTRGQLFTTFFSIFQDPAGQVTGPVLVQLGEHDALWPSTYAAGEAAYWTSAESVTVQSLANVGHDFNTHLDNQTGWRLIDEWITANFTRP